MDFDAIQSAANAANRGDIVFFPAGYEFVGCDGKYIEFRDLTAVVATGAHLKQLHVLLYNGIRWEGGTFLQLPGGSTEPLMRIAGSAIHVNEVAMTYGRSVRGIAAGAYAGVEIKEYREGRPTDIYLSNLRLNAGTKSGITAFDCQRLFVTNTSIKGSDDAVVLKSAPGGQGVDDVALTRITAIGTAGILGIGDLVKTHVRRVTVTNCRGRGLSQLLSFRDDQDSGGGVIENIVCSSLSMTDPTGKSAKRVIEIDIKGGTKVRAVRFLSCRFNGRVGEGNKQAGLSVRCSGSGSVVEDVSLHDCAFVDQYHGALNGPNTPGHPLTDGINIEQSEGGEVRSVAVDETLVDGVQRAFLHGGCDDGRLHVNRPRAFNARKDVQSSKVFVFKSDGWLIEPVTDAQPQDLCRTSGQRVVLAGSGPADPEGTIEAAPGSLWRRTNADRPEALYVKGLGTGTVGWVVT